MAETKIVVDPAPFRVGDEYPWLAERDEDGAVVTFTGKVRNHNLGDSVKALTLEHYPGMTEKALGEIVAEARALAAGARYRDPSHRRNCGRAMRSCLSASPARIAVAPLRRANLLWTT